MGKSFIAENAIIRGDVIIGENCSIYYHTTIRTESDPIVIGNGSNIQDNCVVHADKGYPVVIGENVTVGHSAIVHGCTIEDNCLIGMGAIVMNGARIGRNCIIGAGSLVTQGMVIPEGSLAFGSPCKIKRCLTNDEITEIKENAMHYQELISFYREG